MNYTTHSENETMQLGKDLSMQSKGGTILCLHGDLGAGKTTLVKGIAAGLGITNPITSPTFTLMNVYDAPQPAAIKRLIHIDTYRLKNEHELVEIGAEDYLGKPDTLSIVEWPEKINALLQNKNVVNITINHVSSDQREILIEN